MKQLEPLDPTLARLLRDEPVPEPPPAARDRALSRLDAAFAGLPLMSAAAPAASAAKRIALHLAGIAAGAIAGGGAVALLHSSPSPQVVYVDRPVPISASPAPAPLPPAVMLPTSSAAVPHPSAALSSAPRDDLTQERLVLDDARAHLSAGDPTAALARTDEHLRRFPRGRLDEEREAIAVQALVNAARYDDARARAAALRKRSPNSVFLPVIDVALRSIP